ncbi:LytR/AlgR family response regulator transcription factor [Xylophilus ampelinus]|uniref:LytTR family two component transcriptional regulator n=1 Tax=Xylophilus ampelinus TaxID=54067 RepID=A0A318SJE3_9BURK|nr:LytTR family DNA-binding domain-containing protein [Xylophilus ampelinus]MCS4511351.1 LytTR family DNA-binding domain-containing protein [Xylophilus ampelinus]PYE74893.1 LytTR family two component transcriptional regulator [Xylophilus ampelinus]
MTLDILIVDDEPLARQRLRTLLADCSAPAAAHVDEAGDAAQAQALLQARRFDVVLLDINMPGTDGLALADTMRALPQPPAVVFVTAHAEHALNAFELDAADYLTKPVRLPRLKQALYKVKRTTGTATGPDPTAPPEPPSLLIQDRGRTERVPLDEVLYLKAELKYVTVRTALRSYILDGSLQDLEERFAPRFIRIHRNALVARRAVRALERHYDAVEGEGWAVRVHGVPEALAVSRRQMSAVREALSH